MSSPPLRGTAEWSATREVALLLGLTGGNRYVGFNKYLRKSHTDARGGPAQLRTGKTNLPPSVTLGRGFLSLPLCGACPFVGTVVFVSQSTTFAKKTKRWK